MPSGAVIFGVMEIDTKMLYADGGHYSFHREAPRCKRPAHHLQIGERKWKSRMDYGRDSRSDSDNGQYEDHMAQVCPHCAEEFERAKATLMAWWESGKTLLSNGRRPTLAAADVAASAQQTEKGAIFAKVIPLTQSTCARRSNPPS